MGMELGAATRASSVANSQMAQAGLRRECPILGGDPSCWWQGGFRNGDLNREGFRGGSEVERAYDVAGRPAWRSSAVSLRVILSIASTLRPNRLLLVQHESSLQVVGQSGGMIQRAASIVLAR